MYYIVSLTYPLPRSSLANGMNCRANSSQCTLLGRGPYLAVSSVTRVRITSPRAVSLSMPSSKASCVSSCQNSGSQILSALLDGVVEILDNDLGEVGDVKDQGKERAA